VVAVGGVLPEDVPALRAAGVAGVAAATAVLGDPDPEAAARRFIAAWEAA
jgi:thiamine-phosphate pyrophosphorylase